MRRFGSLFLFGVGGMALFWITFWLLAADASPFNGIMHGGKAETMEDVWFALNCVPYIIIARLPIQPSPMRFVLSVIAGSLWWFVIGCFVWIPFSFFTNRRKPQE